MMPERWRQIDGLSDAAERVASGGRSGTTAAPERFEREVRLTV
jgi:hypothetical protein